MAKLTIPESLYRKVYDHLLRDESEHLAFFLCNIGWAKGHPIFLAREAILMEDADLAGPFRLSLDLKLESLLVVINKAIKDKKALVEAHSHPFSDYPSFSASDKQGFREFVPYMVDSIKGVPYAATVWAKRGISGVCWSAWPQKEEEVEITLIGDVLVKTLSRSRAGSLDSGRYDRQIRAFGKEGQAAIVSLKVGIVGLGGIGCHVAQQLAYLGVRDLTLVDSQVVDPTNLNRLVGATADDIGKAKVEVISRLVKKILPDAILHPIYQDLRSSEAFESMKSVDVIFGCVDNDGARLVLNELSLAYLVPYIDSGVEIEMSDGKVEQVGGRVNLVLPDGPCLHCMRQLDLEEARIALSPAAEIQRARAQGYIRGDDEPSPSVVSLNGIVASLAVTEFTNLATGIRTASRFLAYDMLGTGRGRNAQWVVPQNVERAGGCLECSLSGVGDAINLARYLGDPK